jgi:hypothetical protein
MQSITQSVRSDASEPIRPLSSRLWDLNWSQVLPWRFEEVRVEVSTFDGVMPFVHEHYARIFETHETEPRFLVDQSTDKKRRFGAEMDVFVFQAPPGIVGVLMGHPTDWSTYYMRTVAIMPEYRKRRLLSRFMELSYEPLRAAGVDRVEGECSPANLPMMRMLGSQGFIMTATTNSERWGYVARFTKFLRDDAEATFRRQYCVVPFKAKGTATSSATDLRIRNPPTPRRTS